MTPFRTFLLALASWRMASLLVYEDGPYHMFARLRAWNTFGGLLDCIWCTSVWTAAVALLLERLFKPAVTILALSAAAIGYAKVVE